MPSCPAGHQTSATDFCDTCGLPIAPGDPSVTPAPIPAVVGGPVICPHCQTPNVADALFCEACGYDFTTGSLPIPDAEDPHPQPAPEEPHPQPVPEEPARNEPASQRAAPDPNPEPPAVPTRPEVEWVAELWIDPDWYAAQGSSDPLPSPGLPDIAPLVKEINLIGRVSHSRGVFPDVDCELDTGCSRRHAMLTTDGTRWWIEDLDSANGTFVGGAAGPLPAMPIPQGRVELTPGQRIYVGAWTRIVVRRATDDEKQAFAS
jgi:hypothetical protein